MNALRSMAAALGGEVMKGQRSAYILCPGPGHSSKDRSLSVSPTSTDADGFVCFSHARDDWRACRQHVLGRLGRRAAEYREARRTPRATGKTDHGDHGAAAVGLWREAIDPRGTLAEIYLNRRGLELPGDVAGRVVRFHDACPWKGEDGTNERRPAMLTAFRSIADDRLVAVHRTALAPDGSKTGRRMLGPVAGAAIKIDPDENVEAGIAICEGFETGLAGRELGFRPVWALGSANAIGEFPVLSGIDALTILAETDDSGANAKAVRACGNRWATTDRDVIIATPRVAGDMNDALQS